MMQLFYAKFETANYAHLYQYCLQNALLQQAETNSSFSNFAFSFKIINDGNLVLFSISDDSIDFNNLIFTPENINTAIQQLSTSLNLEVAHQNLSALAELLNSVKLQRVTPETLAYADNDSLDAPLLSFRDTDSPIFDSQITAEVYADTPETAIVAAAVTKPFLSEIARAIQRLNPQTIAVQIDNRIYVTAKSQFSIKEILPIALNELKQKAYDQICAKNLDYLASHVDPMEIFNLSGILTSKERAESAIRSADFHTALAAIRLS